MMGISYGGFTSLQVAAHQPPHLTSIIPMYFTDDRYTDDCHYRGGLLRKYYDVGWYGNVHDRMERDAARPGVVGRGLGADLGGAPRRTTSRTCSKWLRAPDRRPVLAATARSADVPTDPCPAFMIGGWRDGYPNPPLRLYRALKVPKKVLIGPWNHACPTPRSPGRASTTCTRSCAGSTTGARAATRGSWPSRRSSVFMQHWRAAGRRPARSAGEWRAETALAGRPAPASAMLHLGAGGALADEPGGRRRRRAMTTTRPSA